MCYVLNCKIDSLTSNDVLQKIFESLRTGIPCRIVTVNAEYILEAQKDENFKKIINNADLAVADGIGILWATKFQSLAVSSNAVIRIIQCILQYVWTGGSLVFWPAYCRTVVPERVSGAKICERIMNQELGIKNTDSSTHDSKFIIHNSKIFLLGGYNGIAEKIKKQFLRANIVGTYEGIPESESDRIEACKIINETKPDILLVAYGNPASRQEKWIEENLSRLPSVKIAMGVGGSFDFLAGNIARAPKWIQKVGLEWLYRLCRQPRRIGRIFNAVVIFSLSVFGDKIAHNNQVCQLKIKN